MPNPTIGGLIASSAVFSSFKYYDVGKAHTSLAAAFLIAPVMVNKESLNSLGPELGKAVREEAFNTQRKGEKYAIEDVERTAEVVVCRKLSARLEWSSGGRSSVASAGTMRARFEAVDCQLAQHRVILRRGAPGFTRGKSPPALAASATSVSRSGKASG